MAFAFLSPTCIHDITRDSGNSGHTQAQRRTPGRSGHTSSSQVDRSGSEAPAGSEQRLCIYGMVTVFTYKQLEKGRRTESRWHFRWHFRWHGLRPASTRSDSESVGFRVIRFFFACVNGDTPRRFPTLPPQLAACPHFPSVLRARHYNELSSHARKLLQHSGLGLMC